MQAVLYSDMKECIHQIVFIVNLEQLLNVVLSNIYIYFFSKLKTWLTSVGYIFYDFVMTWILITSLNPSSNSLQNSSTPATYNS